MKNAPFEIDRQALLRLTQDLISIESVNPSLVPGGCGEKEIAHFCGDYMQSLGLDVHYQELGQDRTNVIGILHGTGGGKSLMLNGHIDTVGTLGMEIDPLEPRFDGSNVYGRGSFDMKGGVAAMIRAVAEIKRQGVRLKGDVIVAGVCDEEYASIGSEALVKDYRTNAALVCEPTGLQAILAHKGFAWITVDVAGKASHGSLPEEGIDAIAKAGKLLCAVDRMTPEVLSEKSHPLLGSPSIHASLISGGKELSTYPANCRVQLERRTIPGETQAFVEEELRSLLKDISAGDPQFRASAEVFFYRQPFEVGKDEEIVRALSHAYSAVFGGDIEIAGTPAWLDSAILHSAGIPTAVFGPSGGGAHSAVEYVDFESVLHSTMVYAGVMMRYCGVQP